MKKTKFTESQIIKAIKKAKIGRPLAKVSRKLGINFQSLYKWNMKF